MQRENLLKQKAELYMYLRVKVAEELEVKRGRTKLYYGSKHGKMEKVKNTVNILQSAFPVPDNEHFIYILTI